MSIKTIGSRETEFRFNHRNLLESFLDEFGLNTDDVCLDMSVQLYNHGVRMNGDVDLVVGPEQRPRLRRIANRRGDCRVTEDGKIVFREDVEVVQPERYAIFGIADEDLVDDPTYHEVVDGFKLTRLELVVSLKYVQVRKKDKADIQAIRERGIMSGDEWDWDLVHVLPPWERSDTPPFSTRALNYLRSEGVNATVRAGWQKLRRDTNVVELVDTVLRDTRQLKTRYRLEKLRRSGLEYHVACSNVLGAHYTGGEFDGWNLVLACCARSDRFDWIDDSVYERAFEVDPTLTSGRQRNVVVTDDLEVVSGEEVLAAQLLTSPSGTVPISLTSEERTTRCDRRWLENLGFSPEEIRRLEGYRDSLLRDSGVYFFGFIWPSAQHVFDDIEAFVRERVDVKYSHDVPFGEDFESFVLDLYSVDESVREWILEKKVHECRGSSNTVRVIVFEMPDPEFQYDGGVESTAAASLKDSCRKTYYEEMEQYTFDNIIHTTDNYEQNRHARDVIGRWAGVKVTDDPARP